jgi:hypothetical protein
MMKKWMFVLMLIAVGSVSVLADELILSDTFSTNAIRPAGTVLNGDAIEVGGTNWTASVNSIFVGSGEYVWSSYEGNFQYARVPLPDLTGVDILEWQIDARVYGTQADGGVPKGYLALGRSNFNANVQEGVRLTIQQNGAWAVGYHDGSTFTAIGSGNVSGDGEFRGFYPNTLKVRYDFSANTLSAWINSNQVVSAYDMTGKPITFGAAGFVTQNSVKNQNVRYDNFSVTSITAPVPDTAYATIESMNPVSGGVMQLVVSSDNPTICFPKAVTNLVATAGTNWSAVAHSTNGLAPFVVTNLGYSSVSGSNFVIYVQADEPSGFYKIGAE